MLPRSSASVGTAAADSTAGAALIEHRLAEASATVEQLRRQRSALDALLAAVDPPPAAPAPARAEGGAPAASPRDISLVAAPARSAAEHQSPAVGLQDRQPRTSWKEPFVFQREHSHWCSRTRNADALAFTEGAQCSPLVGLATREKAKPVVAGNDLLLSVDAHRGGARRRWPQELSGRVTDRDLPVAFAPHPNPVRLAASACSALEPARRARIQQLRLAVADDCDDGRSLLPRRHLSTARAHRERAAHGRGPSWQDGRLAVAERDIDIDRQQQHELQLKQQLQREEEFGDAAAAEQSIGRAWQVEGACGVSARGSPTSRRVGGAAAAELALQRSQAAEAAAAAASRDPDPGVEAAMPGARAPGVGRQPDAGGSPASRRVGGAAAAELALQCSQAAGASLARRRQAQAERKVEAETPHPSSRPPVVERLLASVAMDGVSGWMPDVAQLLGLAQELEAEAYRLNLRDCMNCAALLARGAERLEHLGRVEGRVDAEIAAEGLRRAADRLAAALSAAALGGDAIQIADSLAAVAASGAGRQEYLDAHLARALELLTTEERGFTPTVVARIAGAIGRLQVEGAARPSAGAGATNRRFLTAFRAKLSEQLPMFLEEDLGALSIGFTAMHLGEVELRKILHRAAQLEFGLRLSSARHLETILRIEEAARAQHPSLAGTLPLFMRLYCEQLWAIGREQRRDRPAP